MLTLGHDLAKSYIDVGALLSDNPDRKRLNVTTFPCPNEIYSVKEALALANCIDRPLDHVVYKCGVDEPKT